MFNFQGPIRCRSRDSLSSIPQSFPFVKYFSKSFFGFFQKLLSTQLLYPRSSPALLSERLSNIALFRGFVKAFFRYFLTYIHVSVCFLCCPESWGDGGGLGLTSLAPPKGFPNANWRALGVRVGRHLNSPQANIICEANII